MIVVADPSPLCYLILIEHAHVLPALFGEVIVPPAVLTELTNERTPQEVRTWLASRPEWLRVQAPREALSHLQAEIDDGEREAIALAVEVSADALPIDDRDGRRHAEALNCRVLGTLRVLADAAEHGFADLPAALEHLRSTNFRADRDAAEHGFADLPAALEHLRSTNFRADRRLIEQILKRTRAT